MSRFSVRKLWLAGLVFGLALRSESLLACAACFGAKTDSPLADGMNWGIMSLLVVVVSVLGGIAAFGIFMAKRAASLAASAAAEQALKSTQKV
jgi:hypothetical protein